MEKTEQHKINRTVLIEKSPFLVELNGHPEEYFYVRKCVGLEEFEEGMKKAGLRYKQKKKMEDYFVISKVDYPIENNMIGMLLHKLNFVRI